MKLLKTVLLLALHGGAHASLRHKATKNAVDAETTQSLVEAAKAGVVKMPGAVAKLFGRAEGAEVPAKQAQGPVEQHQDKFKAGSAPDKVDIYYLGVEGPPADFILVDTKSGAEHRIPIEAGTHITYDNSVYEHRVDAHPDSKRTLLGPASLPSGGRRLEAVGNDSGCAGCTYAEYEQQCNDCSSICLWQDQCEVGRRNLRFGVAETGCCTYDCRRRLTAEEMDALSAEQLQERRRLC